MDKEEWKNIPGYEGIYSISDKGRVKSLPRKRRHSALILKPWMNDKGYYCVTLSKESRKNCRVARLVAKSFLSDFEQGLTVDHINGCRVDNSLSNLRMCTIGQNNMNKGSTQDTSSLFKGVSWSSSRGKWQVTIQIDGKSKYLGRYDCEDTAAKAYNCIARIHFGDFARLNPVGGKTI